MADFTVENHGTLFIIQPMNTAAMEHLRANVDEEAQWWAGGLVVEHRYIENLVAALRAAGWEVE
jgi:hypothetical protein